MKITIVKDGRAWSWSVFCGEELLGGGYCATAREARNDAQSFRHELELRPAVELARGLVVEIDRRGLKVPADLEALAHCLRPHSAGAPRQPRPGALEGTQPHAPGDCPGDGPAVVRISARTTERISSPKRKHMNCKITISMDNAAFDDEPATELARILRDVAVKIEHGEDGFNFALRDLNGNTIGKIEVCR